MNKNVCNQLNMVYAITPAISLFGWYSTLNELVIKIRDSQINTFNPNLLNFLDSILTFLILDDINPVTNSKKIKITKEIIVKCSNPKYFSTTDDIPTNGMVK